ncbi:MAG TPA: beta-galactosidase [Candidatus Brocadiia bacterium]|nr:beta-galactosidase [Candidatus Brocadiia bacterium]
MLLLFPALCGLLAVGQVEGNPNPFGNEKAILSFDGPGLPDCLVRHNVEVALFEQDGRKSLRVDFAVTDWPNVYFTPKSGTWDWSGFAGIAVDIYNPEAQAVSVAMRIDNAGGDGAKNCNQQSSTALPKQWTTFRVHLDTGGPNPFWGMRGVPVKGPLPTGAAIDLAKITAFQVFLPMPSEKHTLIISNVRLFGHGGKLEDLVPLPFVDRFGQYKHADWPGKIKDDKDLIAARKKEESEFRKTPKLRDRDKFGGWAKGPKLKATGWFRTEKVDGKWWLVTPEGRLFFSLGVDCVGTWDRTFVEKREPWFEWLPAENSEFKPAFGYEKGAHSMADIIGGKGRVFGFYNANLIRKYGPDWPALWRENSYARLRAWGFNTLGNWCQGDVLDNSRMPFVASTGVWGDYRRIEGGGGYWSKMHDAYDPKFEPAVRKCVENVTKQYGGNPLCIGYFVDNEIAWEAVERGTLASPADQPCRVEMVKRLKEKYGTLEKLNAAWGASAKDWDELRAPDDMNEACREDVDAFVYAFARRYFEVCRDALRVHAPRQLYLGSRFSSRPPQVVRAAADVCDVVSYNLYYSSINGADWTGENDIGKPIIIGEFHFGALDRGMFHTGLVAAENQKHRAECYRKYVRSVADCPSFVGCHWFQYIDEPLTGRWFDGENYNIGFVSQSDTPYAEMVEAAKEVHAEIYERRSGEGK